MKFADMNWMDVETYLDQDDRVVLVVGSCEQHSTLSLMTDVLIPMKVAETACQREQVLIAPALPYGITPYFTAYPGTISLRPETMAAVVREVLEGLLAQGFRRVLVSNGHGGNTGLLTTVLIELGNAHPEAGFSIFHWWRNTQIEAVAEAAGLQPNHANWTENFPFTRVGPVPEGEKVPPELPPTGPATAVRAALGDGSFGGPYQAPEGVMDQLFAAAVEAMVEAIQAV